VNYVLHKIIMLPFIRIIGEIRRNGLHLAYKKAAGKDGRLPRYIRAVMDALRESNQCE
jgi:hypothetical protein